jgi:hypothetical protein
MIGELTRVVLTAAVPEHGLEPGDVGTVVHVYADRQALEVEFTFLNGHTAVVATVEAPLFDGRGSAVRAVTRRDITHSRELRVR